MIPTIQVSGGFQHLPCETLPTMMNDAVQGYSDEEGAIDVCALQAGQLAPLGLLSFWGSGAVAWRGLEFLQGLVARHERAGAER